MKYNLITIFAAIMIVVAVFSCEKETTETIEVNQEAVTDFKSDTTITHIITEDRNGNHNIKTVDGSRNGIKSDYFYNQSWTTRNLLTQAVNPMKQIIFNKTQVDSFTFVRAMPVVVHLIGTGLLSVYRVQGWIDGVIVYDFEHLALFKGEVYTESPTGGNDLANNSVIQSIKYMKTTTTENYFDLTCGINRIRYNYLVEFNQDPQTQIQAFINSKNCITQLFILNHKWI